MMLGTKAKPAHEKPRATNLCKNLGIRCPIRKEKGKSQIVQQGAPRPEAGWEGSLRDQKRIEKAKKEPRSRKVRSEVVANPH